MGSCAIVLISELADPNNHKSSRKIRYVEIYSPDGQSLSGYVLRRWTNSATTSTTSRDIDLSAVTLSPGQAYVVCHDKSDFDAIYPVRPHISPLICMPIPYRNCACVLCRRVIHATKKAEAAALAPRTVTTLSRSLTLTARACSLTTRSLTYTARSGRMELAEHKSFRMGALSEKTV